MKTTNETPNRDYKQAAREMLKNAHNGSHVFITWDICAAVLADALKERDTAIDRSLELLSKLGEVRGGLDSVKQERDYLLSERDSLRIEIAYLKDEVTVLRAKPRTPVSDDNEAKRNGFSPCPEPYYPAPFDQWLQDRIDVLSTALYRSTAANAYGGHLGEWADELALLSDMLERFNEAMEEGETE